MPEYSSTAAAVAATTTTYEKLLHVCLLSYPLRTAADTILLSRDSRLNL